ncbi:MAG: bifunctional 3-deoxy-7-phosphoheptulonate synthase/chorismate mutase type II [Lepagella sp.]
MEDILPLFDTLPGMDLPIFVAGPCSVESRDQVLETAKGVAECGIRFFRAGIWKPRTKPGSFEGIGAKGLPWLMEVKHRFGLLSIIEVATPAHLRAALRVGISAFWLGARTVTNPFAVQDIANLLAELPADRRNEISILIKNPVNPDIELWIGAIQRIYAAGIRRIAAIHRGFAAYDEKIYRNRPMWRIPIELKRRIPNLQILCDPSHIAGRRDLISSLCRRAMDMNFAGLFIESHCNPDAALSDARQQVTPSQLASILEDISHGRNEDAQDMLALFREDIDRIDSQLVALLANRMEVARRIGRLKLSRNIPVVQQQRYNQLIARRVEEAAELGLSPEFMNRLLGTIHEESVRVQIDLRNDNLSDSPDFTSLPDINPAE